MNKDELKKKFNIDFFSGFYWLLVFVILLYLFQNNVLCLDDIFFNFMLNGKISFNSEFFYGSWVMPLDNILMYYLPYKLHINLQDWAQLFGGTLEALTVFVIVKYLSKFIVFSDISKKLKYTLTTLILFSLIFLYNLVQFKDIIIYLGFFRFIIPSALFVVWSYYFYKNFRGIKVNPVMISVLSVLAASSSEVVGVLMVLNCIFCTLYLFLNKKEVKIFALITGFAFLGLLLLVFSQGFQYHLNAKTEGSIFSLSTLFENFVPFLKLYIKQLFLVNGLFFVIIGGLIFFNKKVSEKSKEEMLFGISQLISALIFAFLLIFLGKTHENGVFWIAHEDIYTILYTVFLLTIVVLSIVPIQHFNLSKGFGKVVISLFVLLTPLFLVSAFHVKNSLLNIKDFTYLRDKMTLFYLAGDSDIVLPSACHTHSTYMLMNHVFIKFDAFLAKYMRQSDEKELEDINSLYKLLFENYYKIVYNRESTEKQYSVIFTEGKDSMAYFRYLGGSYSEIKSHKYHFSDLEKK